MPPITTTAKVTTITSAPMPGATWIMGAVNAPPSAPRKAPTMNVPRYRALTLMPMAAAISRSWMSAVRQRPVRVRVSTHQMTAPTVTARPITTNS